MDIGHCIPDLLAGHDCVIIPGFGGFIGNYSPAQIDPVHHAFRPPSKKLLFNVNLKQNDGLLATCVSNHYGASYEDACAMIDTFVQTCKSVLKSGKPFIIPEVGRLYPGREGNIQFEQDKTSNLLPESFGLVPFISPPMSRNIRTSKPERTLVSTTEARPEKRWAFSRSLRWAAILAFPIGIAAVIGMAQYDKIQLSKASDAGIFSSVLSRFSSTALVNKKEAPSKPSETTDQYAAPLSVFEQEPESNSNDLMDPDNPDVQTDLDFSTLPEAPVSDQAIRPDDRYAVIVGAFRSKENAENLVLHLQRQGVTASVYDRSKSGLYRVAIGTFSQHEEAMQLLSSAKSGDYSGAWLLTK